MPLALTQVKVLGPAPSPHSQITTSHRGTSQKALHSPAKVTAGPLTPKHFPHLCLLMPNGSTLLQEKNFKLFDRIKVQPQLVPIKFIHFPVIPKPLRLSEPRAISPQPCLSEGAPSHFIFQMLPRHHFFKAFLTTIVSYCHRWKELLSLLFLHCHCTSQHLQYFVAITCINVLDLRVLALGK